MLRVPENYFTFNPGKLNVDTRTAIAKLYDEKKQRTKLSSKLIFWTLPVIEPIIGVCYSNLRRVVNNTIEIQNQKNKAFGHGYQCTVEMEIRDCNINLKIFQTTGSLQITGCKRTLIGLYACRVLVNRLNHLIRKINGWVEVSQACCPNQPCSRLWPRSSLDFHEFRLCGMKCRWSLNMDIDLSDLDNILRTKYNLISSYDPSAAKRGFHGIKATIYWNENKNGICYHHDSSDCNCLKIFVTTFRTGSAGMMGGAATDEQIYEIYRFYTRIIKENQRKIRVLNRKQELIQNFSFKKLVYCDTEGKPIRIRTLCKPIQLKTSKEPEPEQKV